MAIETAEDLDIFFDPEEMGVSAFYTAPGGAALPLVAIQEQGDGQMVSARGRIVMAANHFLLRADIVTPVAKARIDLVDAAGNALQSFTLQGDPSLQMYGSIWRCPAVPVA